MPFYLAQEFHDIAPPVDYSLIPTWVVFVGAFMGLSMLGGLIWWFVRWRARQPARVQTARERALFQLDQIRSEIEHLQPYEFSIVVSYVLRRYVSDQFHLPVTQQTSVEFLNGVSQLTHFSADDRTLLDHFLNRCDLIKFARYDATREDSRVLLDEATQFVQGGALEPA